MFRSWKLGTAFGIGIYVHPSFLLLPALILFQTAGHGGLALVVFSLGLLAAVFGCVVLHELGHALAARSYGIQTRDITLYPIGGVARLERMSERPWEEFWIALAGPAVNVVIALVLGALLELGAMSAGLGWVQESVVGTFLLALLQANLFLVLFNLLPAFPMDGGRVLRALLAAWYGRLRGTEIAAAVGIVMAVLIGLSTLIFGNPMLVLIGLFVAFAGQAELAAVRHKEALRQAEPVDALPADEPAPGPAQRGFTGFAWDSQFRAWVLWRDGRRVATYHVNPQ